MKDSKLSWDKIPLDFFTDEEFELLLLSVSKTDAFLQLYKSCKNALSRSFVIENAAMNLDPAEYCVFIKYCIKHVEDLSTESMKKPDIPDEQFNY